LKLARSGGLGDRRVSIGGGWEAPLLEAEMNAQRHYGSNFLPDEVTSCLAAVN
jgi:hypothetical protein